jgi:hypothetical protein
MHEVMKLAKIILKEFGIDTKKSVRAARGLPAFLRNYRLIKRQSAHSALEFPFAEAYPCLTDRYAGSGVAKGHYFHQDLLVAQKIFAANPSRHVDIGSRVDGFVAHVATFRRIEVFDIRELENKVENILFRQLDLMAVPDEYSDYTDSLSCLHTLEHLGLGRYGDPLDYDGYISGFNGLARILRPGGTLYLSVPIGRQQRINFDAHRVFAVDTVLQLCQSSFEVAGFSYVDDEGDLHQDVDPYSANARTSFDCRFGCGIFELKKRRA